MFIVEPPGLSGTLQGVALGVSFGLGMRFIGLVLYEFVFFWIGRGVGLLIASFIYTLIKPRVLFLIIAIFNLIAAIIFSLYFILNRERSKKSIEKNQTIMNESGNY